MRRAVGQFRRWSPDLVRALSLAVLVLRAPPTGPRHRSLIAGVPLSFFGSYIPLSPVPVSPRSQREERAAACGKFIAPDWCVSSRGDEGCVSPGGFIAPEGVRDTPHTRFQYATTIIY